MTDPGITGKRTLDVEAYYREVTSADLLGVARDLIGERITQETATVVYCDCPHHDSASKRSLQLSVHQGLFTCWGCSVSGDVLQFVEFIRTGKVTHGARGPMPASHREARDWLAAKIGLPPLSSVGLTPEERAAAHARLVEAEDTYGALTELAQHYHDALLANDEVRDWIRKKYGIEDESISRLKIGWANDPNAFETVAPRCRSPRNLGATGAFNFDGQDNAHPFFVGRVVFPYWSRGRVVYMIGRSTPWTPDTQFERGKYKKLPVRNERTRAGISRAIDNRVLFGEDVLSTNPARLLVVEGVTDQIVATQLGFASIALTSASLAEEDFERIAKKVRGVGTVYMLQDTELSGVGVAGAIRTARAFEFENVACLVATIPPGPVQVAAAAGLLALVGRPALDAAATLPPTKRAASIREAAGPEKAERVGELIAQTKIDLADWRVAGAGTAEVEAALAAARPALEVAIALAPKIEDAVEQVRAIEPILAEIAAMRPAERERMFKLLRERTGLAATILKGEAREAAKAAKDAKKGKAGGQITIDDAPPGSCRAVVARAMADAKDAGEAPSWSTVAELVYNWLDSNGAHFFRDQAGAPLLFWENEIWPMASDFTGPRVRHEGLMYRLTGMVPTTSGARTFFSTLRALVADRGQVRDEFPWSHADVNGLTVWVNLNNARHELARIDPDGVTIVPNGANEKGVILRGDPKFRPIEYMPQSDPANLDRGLRELIGRYLACDPLSGQSLLDWISCFPLIEFAGTRPMVRLEGPAGSGKTWAAKMLTSLVFGQEQQKKSTDAANYTDASRNPLVALDNVETTNTTPALIDFLLTSVTGITREKRAMGSDSATISERPLSLVMSTGVEPLGAELEEVMSRSIVVEFDRRLQSDVLLEKRILGRIIAARDLALSAIFRRTSLVLGMMRDGGHERAMRSIRETIGDHGKARCDEFLSLMYLQRVAAAPEGARAGLLERISPAFVSSIRSLDRTTAKSSRDASQVATPMIALFSILAGEFSNNGGTGGFAPSDRSIYGLRVSDSGGTIHDATQSHLFIALRGVAKDRGVPFPYKNASQFGTRFSSSMSLMREQGFEVTTKTNRFGVSLYTISFDRDRGAMTRIDATVTSSNRITEEAIP